MNKIEVLENGNVKITIPMSFRSCAGRKRIVTQELNTNFNEPIITNLARAFRWQALIDSGKFSNVHELATLRYLAKTSLFSAFLKTENTFLFNQKDFFSETNARCPKK